MQVYYKQLKNVLIVQNGRRTIFEKGKIYDETQVQMLSENQIMRLFEKIEAEKDEKSENAQTQITQKSAQENVETQLQQDQSVTLPNHENVAPAENYQDQNIEATQESLEVQSEEQNTSVAEEQQKSEYTETQDTQDKQTTVGTTAVTLQTSKEKRRKRTASQTHTQRKKKQQPSN